MLFLDSELLRGSVNISLTSTCHRLSRRLQKSPRPQAETELLQCTVEQILDVPLPEIGDTVGGSAEHRFPGQNPAADCGKYQ